MTVNLDDTRRAYEAAKMLDSVHESTQYEPEARLLLTNASQDYAQALVDDAQRKLDAMGVVIGETKVVGFDGKPTVIVRIFADVMMGEVFCDDGHVGLLLDVIRPYVAPVAKEMVLEGWTSGAFYPDADKAPVRITLSNVTPADLDAMKPGDVVEGSYKIERMKK